MNLEGNKVALKKAGRSDVDAIMQWENNPDHWLVSDTIAPFTREQVLEFVEQHNDLYRSGQMRMMITEREKGLTVGCIDLYDFDPKNRRVGIGILVDPAFRGKGYGHEALELLVGFCTETLEAHGVYAEVLSTNESSLHLFEAAGFRRSGTKADWLWDGNAFIDQHLYQKVVNS